MKKAAGTLLVLLFGSALLCAPAFGQSDSPATPAAQDLVAKSEVETAISMLQAICDKQPDKAKAKKLGADLLRELRYGADGYFWADTTEGVNVVLYGRKDVEGKNRLNDRDANGKYLIKDLIDKAKEGGGYVEYWFTKKGQATPEPKRSYVKLFEPFGWVVGTGYYCPAPLSQAEASDLSHALDQVGLFTGLTGEAKQALQSVARLTHVKAGERIITQGSALDRMYIILSAPSEIRVDGKPIAANPGQALVGELEFLDAPPASADVIVLKDGDVIELGYAALSDLLQKQPRLGYSLMREFARIEAQRLRANNRMRTDAPAPAGK